MRPAAPGRGRVGSSVPLEIAQQAERSLPVRTHCHRVRIRGLPPGVSPGSTTGFGNSSARSKSEVAPSSIRDPRRPDLDDDARQEGDLPEPFPFDEETVLRVEIEQARNDRVGNEPGVEPRNAVEIGTTKSFDGSEPSRASPSGTGNPEYLILASNDQAAHEPSATVHYELTRERRPSGGASPGSTGRCRTEHGRTRCRPERRSIGRAWRRSGRADLGPWARK